MSTEGITLQPSTATAAKDGERDDQPKRSPPPPPPEKPLPDDCCGSGCVRCVWDIYYDELEAYNKLYKIDGSDSDPSKSS
ncbi:uncharacterized protein J3R85_015439 [Psidium guajava]|nr:uncharacterized protein J3R85_015439 [Psidium guajava]